MGRRPTLEPLWKSEDPPLPRYPQVLVRGRQAGKTTHSLHWVANGVKVGGYPGWSRVLVVPTIQIEMMMRTMAHPDGGSWWNAIEDWSHRVYDYRTWANAHGCNPKTEVRVDEINLLWDFLQLPGTMTGFTMTGEEWKPEISHRWEGDR